MGMADFGREKEAALKVAFADFVIAWNHLEKSASFLLFRLVGGDARAEVLTSRLQASALSEAIRPLAQIHPNPLRDHILTFATLFDRLRGWRNHYVHGIFIIGWSEDEEPGGMIQSTRIARKKLAMSEHLVTTPMMVEAHGWIIQLKQFLDGITPHLYVNFPLERIPLETLVAPAPAPDLPPYFDSPFLPARSD